MRVRLIISLGVIVLCAAPATAVAATTVGPPTSAAGNAPVGCSTDPMVACTFTNLQSGNSRFISPVDGVITRWRVRGAQATGQDALRVLRSPASGTFTAVATSAVETVPPGESVFTTRLNIRAGDGIGIDVPGGPGYPAVEVQSGLPGGASLGFFLPKLADNQPAVSPTGTVNDGTLLFNADIEPDADHDNFGDETQDQCPTQADTQAGCDLTGPAADITKTPKKKTDSRKATFKFTSDDPNATFRCRLDKKPFVPCSSPKRYRKLKVRKHRFRVQGTDSKGNVGPIDSFRWRVVD